MNWLAKFLKARLQRQVDNLQVEIDEHEVMLSRIKTGNGQVEVQLISAILDLRIAIGKLKVRIGAVK